jgi:lipopolysaccharide/colanic/teichoic acid biosynthesis glycosyltransferase
VARRLRAKRIVESLLAAALLVLSLPLLAILVILVQLESRGPVFHRCDRTGFGGRPLRMIKLRKMRPGVAGAPLTGRNDDRLTRVGAWLARSRLDELPQLWHVVCGDMALIGPRPEDPRFVAAHVRDYETILSVRPGITGLAQVAFVDEWDHLSGEDAVAVYHERILPRKVRIDRYYALRRSWWLDLRIVALTPVAIVRGRAIERLAAEIERELPERAAAPATATNLVPRLTVRRPGRGGETTAPRDEKVLHG